MLAQSAGNSESSGGSTRVRTRGLGKLIGLVVLGLLAAGKFMMGFFTGGNRGALIDDCANREDGLLWCLRIFFPWSPPDEF